MGYTHLDSRSDDLVWVGYDQREEFAGSGSDYVRSVGLYREQKKKQAGQLVIQWKQSSTWTRDLTNLSSSVVQDFPTFSNDLRFCLNAKSLIRS